MLELLQQSHVAKAKKTTTQITGSSSSSSSNNDNASSSVLFKPQLHVSIHRVWWLLLAALTLFALVLGYYQVGLVSKTMKTATTEVSMKKTTTSESTQSPTIRVRAPPPTDVHVEPKRPADESSIHPQQHQPNVTRIRPGPPPTSTTIRTGLDDEKNSSSPAPAKEISKFILMDALSEKALSATRQRQERHAQWKLQQQRQQQSTAFNNAATYNYISKCPLKPTTNWTKSQVVHVTPDTNWTLLYNDQSLVPVYSRLEDFLLGRAELFDVNHANSGNSSASRDEQALCEMYDEPDRPPQIGHFPHAMEHIYRCWSYWQSFPHAQAVLLYPSGHDAFPANVSTTGSVSTAAAAATSTSNFLEGMLQALTRQLNVTLRPRQIPADVDGNATNNVLPHHPDAVRIKHTPNFQDGYAMLSPLHAQAMVNGIFGPVNDQNDINDNLHINDDEDSANNNPTACPCPPSDQAWPRIAILNRERSHKRSLRNDQELANAIEDAIMDSTAFANSSTNIVYSNSTGQHQPQQQPQQQPLVTVPIIYFEDATFMEQLQFFAHYDIVITGHGAQLTGLPFMRQPMATAATADTSQRETTSTTCRASILEIFPAGYCIPSFFGSLAVASGHDHYYVSMGEQGCNLSKRRVQARQVNLCPNWHAVVKGIMQLVQDWRENNCASRRHFCSCRKSTHS